MRESETRRITARTSVAAVIGHPVGQSLSPAIHNVGFDSTGVDWTYVAIDVPVSGLPAFMSSFAQSSLAGLSVTMPHKKAMAGFMDWIDQIANLVPPLIGPIIVDYYIFHGRHYDTSALDELPAWNPVAVLSFAAGVVAAYAYTPPWMASGLWGLIVSMVAYLILFGGARVFGIRLGYSKVRS
ncbi:MAG: hypothetical protein EBY80_13880 [Actinobacteria bacterium]|nr:hypothetical protein [Actinomycetota bacterium]